MTRPTSLHGIWQMVRAEFDGETAPGLMVQRTALELAPRVYIVRFDGRVTDRGELDVDPVSDTKTLVLRGMEGLNAGRTIPCIYQLVGDRLRICYGLDGVTPTTFTTAPDRQRYLATYRRRGAQDETETAT